ncbi:MAG: alkaline phosphatase D family protein [Bacteroidota bacterium]
MKANPLYLLCLGLLLLACKSRPILAITTAGTYLYHVPAHNQTYLIDQNQRYLYQWQGKTVLQQALTHDQKRISLPGFVNLDAEKVLWGPAIDSTLRHTLVGEGHIAPPFNKIEFKQSLTRARRDKQYKRLMRETIAEIEAGYMLNARQFLDTFLIQNPNDVEAHYAEALWFARRNRAEEAIMSMEKALALGMSIERFLSASPILWDPFWSRDEFQNWLTQHAYSPILNGPLLGDLGANNLKIRLKLWGEETPMIYVFEGGEEQSFAAEKETDFPSGNVYLFQLEGLKAETNYQYEIRLGERKLGIGEPYHFRTSVRQGQTTNFSLAFGGGAGYTPWKERMWDTILANKADLMLLLGDNVYIDHPERPATQQYCYSRRQHRPEWQRLVSQVPTYTIWDDHDFTYNDARGGEEVDAPYWKKDVWRLYEQQWANPAYGQGETAPGCYYQFSRGDVDFFMLDTRYYREDPKQSGASMLGEVQKKWLKEALLASKASFKVICSSVPMAPNTKPGSLDTWDGHAAEREQLFDFLTQNQIEGVLLLAADRHRSDLWEIKRKNAYPLYEMMSSRLTNVHVHQIMPESIFGYNDKCSFGMLDFETDTPEPSFTYRIINIDNETIFSRRFLLRDLQ